MEEWAVFVVYREKEYSQGSVSLSTSMTTIHGFTNARDAEHAASTLSSSAYITAKPIKIKSKNVSD